MLEILYKAFMAGVRAANPEFSYRNFDEPFHAWLLEVEDYEDPTS